MINAWTLSITQALIVLTLLVVGVYAWKPKGQIVPFVLSPGAILTASILIGSFAAYSLDPNELGDYAVMWLLQAIGMILGLSLSSPKRKHRKRQMRIVIDIKALWLLSATLMALSVLCALLFFAAQGVPILMNDIEQGRVNAAAEGTGYFRLLAYMSIPAAVTLFSISAKGRWLFVAVAFLIIMALANRSPLLYLVAPIVFGYVIAENRRIKSGRIVGLALILGALVVGVGTYRIISQQEFRKYSEYRVDLAEGNTSAIAVTSLVHYAKVVADNAILSKYLSDRGLIPRKYGSSYFLLFLTALPGEQLSLDREIKLASGKTFIGGGTPPTLMGEGYINFGYIGILIAGAATAFLLSFWYNIVTEAFHNSSRTAIYFASVIYGFSGCWVILAQVAGFAGASTAPAAMFILYLGFWLLTSKRRTVNDDQA